MGRNAIVFAKYQRGTNRQLKMSILIDFIYVMLPALVILLLADTIIYIRETWPELKKNLKDIKNENDQ